MSWYDDAKSAAYRAVCLALSMDPEGSVAARMVRYAYQGRVTTPQLSSDDDVIFLDLSARPDPANDAIEHFYDKRDGQPALCTRKTIPLTLLCVCYGPSAEVHAENLWSGVFMDGVQDSPREVLRRASMVPVPPAERPVAMHELEGSLWRRRVDVRIRLNLLSETAQTIPVVTVAPQININTGGTGSSAV